MKACYPGSFDPITSGHMDIIKRSADIFDEVVILLMENPRKSVHFSAEERKEMIEDSIEEYGLENVTVVIGSGLTVEMARKTGAKVIIRGLRFPADYDYELTQASANMVLAEEIETLFMNARPALAFLSSSTVREIAMNGGDFRHMVPVAIYERVKGRFDK